MSFKEGGELGPWIGPLKKEKKPMDLEEIFNLKEYDDFVVQVKHTHYPNISCPISGFFTSEGESICDDCGEVVTPLLFKDLSLNEKLIVLLNTPEDLTVSRWIINNDNT